VAEAWVHNAERLAMYVRNDELHTAFNFDFLLAPWLADEMRAAVEGSLAAHDLVGAPPTWVLSNHDTVREVSRYARDPKKAGSGHRLRTLLGLPADFELGRRRARAAALLMLALPGGAYVYQGEELGLAEVEDIPEEALQDPTWEQSGHTDRGRDGCRVPIPWSGDAPPFGFSPPDAVAEPWLPQPLSWRGHTAADQEGDPDSMLELYRRALGLRRSIAALGDGRLEWADAPAGTLMFTREPGFACLVVFDGGPVDVPAGWEVVLASGPLEGGRLPSDTAVWLARG
jgi:alpha-glucosidase